MQTFDLHLCRSDFGVVADEIGLQFGHFDADELLTCCDDITFIDGDFFDVTCDARLEFDLLPSGEVCREADPAVDGALFRLGGGKFQRGGAGRNEEEREKEVLHAQ